MVKTINPKQFFTNLEAIYAKRLNAFIATANRHIYNRDYSLDAVHDAFAKAQKYFNENKSRKVREKIIHFLVIKACKKYNRTSREIPRSVFDEGNVWQGDKE